MKFTPKGALCALLSLALALSVFAAPTPQEEADAAFKSASTYLFANNLPFVYKYLSDHVAALEQIPADELTLNRARALRDSYLFSPTLSLGDPTKEGVFFGGDRYMEGFSAVQIPMVYGFGTLEDHLHLIPHTTGELMVLLSLSFTGEGPMRRIGFGREDEAVIALLSSFAAVEGRLYLSIAPAVNMMRNTSTLRSSFISCYVRIAELARRYAPNVSLVFTLGDGRVEGSVGAARFFPGKEYVDVLGVQVCHTYPRSAALDPAAALDCRGDYYSPLTSVARALDEMRLVAGPLPLIVEGVSFPYAGKCALEDPLTEMEEFYKNLPALCRDTLGVFYSNVSSSLGVSNLRGNKELEAKLLEMSRLPFYKNLNSFGEDVALTPISQIEKVAIGEAVPCLTLWGGHVFGDLSFSAFCDGAEVADRGLILSDGVHTLSVYVSDPSCQAHLKYSLTVAPDGTFVPALVTDAATDFNGNGFLDFGDVQYLTAAVAGWDFPISEGAVADVNGDGRVNLSDAVALRQQLLPPSA